MSLEFKSYSDLISLVNTANGTYYTKAGKLVGVDYSTTSLSITVAPKTLFLDATNGNNRDYKVDDLVLLTAQAGTTGTMLGKVTLYTPNNQGLLLNILSVTGSGTGSLWRVVSQMPRIDFHPDTKAFRGIRVEPEGSNVFLNSADALVSRVSGGTLTDNTLVNTYTSPEGNLSVRKLTVSGSPVVVRMGDTTNGVANTRYCGSVFITTAVDINEENVPATVTTTFNNVGTTNFSIDSLKWYRIFATAATNNTLRHLNITLPVGTYYLFGGQIDTGYSTPMSYLPTRSSSETRLTDIITSSDTSYLASLLSTSNTYIVTGEHEIFPEDDNLAHSLVSISDGTVSNIISLQMNNQAAASYSARVNVVSSGTNVYSHSYANDSFPSGNKFRFGVTTSPNRFTSSFSNTFGSVDTAGTVPSGLNQFYIGSTNGTLDQWRGWISIFEVYPYAMTDAELLEQTDTIGTPLIHSL